MTATTHLDDTGEPVSLGLDWIGIAGCRPIDHYEILITDDATTGVLVIDDGIYATLEHLGYSWEAVSGNSLSLTGASFPAGGERSFFLRAVDDKGLCSLQPAYLGLRGLAINPTVEITNPVDLGSPGGTQDTATDILVRWYASIQDNYVLPDSTRFVLLQGEGPLSDRFPSIGGYQTGPDELEWSPWRHWDEVDDLNPYIGGTSALLNGLVPGARYMFLVQAKRGAEVTRHFEDGVNYRQFRALSSFQPTMILQDNYLGAIVAAHSETHDFTIVQDQPLSLSWQGVAWEYGSEITGYRFGWDILDVEDDSQWSDWSLLDVESSASFAMGMHSFHLECRDLSDNRTRIRLRFLVVPFTMERELLLVDDYDNSHSWNPSYCWPSGPAWSWGTYWHDDIHMMSFWNNILTRYGGYHPVIDFFRVSVVNPVVPFELLANYAHVIWEVKEESPGSSGIGRVAGFIDPYVVGDHDYDYLSTYLDRGGQLLLCGSNPLGAMLPNVDQMGDEQYERKSPTAFLHHLRFSQGPLDDEDAVRRFLPFRFFGLDAVANAVDQDPRNLAVAGDDLPTVRTFWGATGFRWNGGSETVFPNTTNWQAGDTLVFKPEVYQWFEDAGPVFSDPNSYDDPEGLPHVEFGLNDVEIYNWNWLDGLLANFREDEYLRLLDYVPADPTTRWGESPSAEHIYLMPNGQHYDEMQYSVPGDWAHSVGIIGNLDAGNPQVLLGFVPYYLDDEVAEDLIDQILLDIFDMDM